MFISFTAARNLVLRVLYEAAYTNDDKEWFSPSEIRSLCDDAFSVVFTRKVISGLLNADLIDKTDISEDDSYFDYVYSINADGIMEAESVIAKESEGAHLVATIPASDRLVTINHNSPEAEAVVAAVRQADEVVRSSNSIPEEQRDWIRSQLAAGMSLLTKAKTMTLGAVKSLLLSPLSAALKAIGEEQAKDVLLKAIAAVRTWLV